MQRTVYTEEHEAFRDAAREFVERQVKPRMETMREQREIDRPTWLEAGKQGLLGVPVPEEYGGGGVDDFRFNSVVNEELSKVSAALGSSFSIHADICLPYLLELTTEEPKQRWLPGFSSGEIIPAIGMTEPSGGSDLAALRTPAKKDGDSYIVNGSKTFITHGHNRALVPPPRGTATPPP